jgi:hypothetical protein
MSALATLSDLKARLGFSGSEEDALLTRKLEMASAQLARLAGRESLLRESGRVEHPREPGAGSHYTHRVKLALWPIESVSEVRQRWDWSTAWSDAEELTQGDDFEVDAEMGMLVRSAGWFNTELKMLRVTYTGGYHDPAISAPTVDAVAPPEWVQDAVLAQAVRAYQTDEHAGRRDVQLGGQGGSISLSDDRIHPRLREAAKRLRRYGL